MRIQLFTSDGKELGYKINDKSVEVMLVTK